MLTGLACAQPVQTPPFQPRTNTQRRQSLLRQALEDEADVGLAPPAVAGVAGERALDAQQQLALPR